MYVCTVVWFVLHTYTHVPKLLHHAHMCYFTCCTTATHTQTNQKQHKNTTTHSLLFLPVSLPISKMLDWALGRDMGNVFSQEELKRLM